MNILIAGSIDPKIPPDQQKQFETATKELAKYIVNNGHTLVISSDRADTADAFAFKAAIPSIS